MSRYTRSKRRPSRRKCMVQKPHGALHPRVKKVGPDRFGLACFDCHKAASKWMSADFYGKVLVEPTKVHHTRPELEATVSRIRKVAAAQHHLKDLVMSIERTGNFGSGVQGLHYAGLRRATENTVFRGPAAFQT